MTAYEYDTKLRKMIAQYQQVVVDAAHEAIRCFEFDDDCNLTNESEVVCDIASELAEDHDIMIDLDEFRTLINAVCTVGAAAYC